MKKLCFFIAATIALYGCQKDIISEKDQETHPMTRATVCMTAYYWCDGEKIPLTVNEDKLFILTEPDNVARLCRSNGVVGIDNLTTSERYRALGIKSLVSTTSAGNLTSFTLDGVGQGALDMDYVVYAAPYFKTESGSDIGITNVFSVRLTGERDFAKLQKLAQEYNLEMLGANEFDPSIYYLACTKESKGNALEMANLMYESGAFDYATPEFIIRSAPVSSPNDPYFSSQWNLNNASYPDIDISYVDAMEDFTFPYIDDIIVAVVDNGISNSHPDLPLYGISYDAHNGKTPSVLYGDHGTKVAGVIGATANNGKGIAGVAPGVKIMPVSICYTKDGEKLGISASSATKFANAIRFAANNGARIINNSWAFETTSPIPELNDAISYAISKDCIVVFASGNDSGAVSQPAAGAQSATLVVGAIEKDGYKADFSNYGSSVDVAAPGTNIWTTSPGGGYTCVSGTSFAAPHVAGIAALIWAIDPDIQAWRVRDIIEQSTKKEGGFEFEITDIRRNGLWNQYVGYGLVDAYMALSAASGSTPATPVVKSTLSEVDPGDLSMMGLGYDKWNIAYLARDRGVAECYVENYDPSVSYVWSSTLPPYHGTGSTFIAEFESDSSDPELHDIECQALKNGLRSTSGIHIALISKNYSY